MNAKELEQLLDDVAKGKTKTAAAQKALQKLLEPDLGYARVDHHRSVRCGFPEVIFGEGKTPAQVAGISREILAKSDILLATRATREMYQRVKRISKRAVFHPVARCIVVDKRKSPVKKGLVTIVTAGTSDIPVAEEALVTAGLMGARVETVYDAGVAGIHRIMGSLDKIRDARAIVVAAGMEGALASVVGGLVDKPVIAVPTSIGYGASFGGVAALLGMLNSCASNVSVVNIDNGFGAGYMAALINRGS